MGFLKKNKGSDITGTTEDLSFTTCPQCKQGQLCPGFATTMSGSKTTSGKVFICDKCHCQIVR